MEDKANAEVLGGGEITFSNDGSECGRHCDGRKNPRSIPKEP